MATRILQFKITLREIEPPIWRRILVPENHDFWDLHVAIQNAMGWTDSHLHEFRIRRKHGHSVAEIGIPEADGFEDEREILAGWKVPLTRYFNDLGVCAEYEYDFGDSWKHDVLLEGILLKEKSQKYPKCIGGERSCPPEDCGGIYGYQDLLEIIFNPSHEEHERMMEWLGGKYEPEEFSAEKVKFQSAKKRWREVFERR